MSSPQVNNFVEDPEAADGKVLEREKTRLTKSTGKSVSASEGKLGDPSFKIEKDPKYLKARLDLFVQKEKLDVMPRREITITLPDGAVKEGTAWETTPYSIAENISKGLAENTVIAKVTYTEDVDKGPLGLLHCEDGLDVEAPVSATNKGELWDMHRPLIGSCRLELLKFDEPEAKMVFWHSSAHMLGSAMECQFGCQLCQGPPVDDGFFYDAYMGKFGIELNDFKGIEEKVGQIVKEKQTFERLVLSKEQLLVMFRYNPFKVSLISNKIPDGTFSTVYRNGNLIDLCKGPHIPNTGKVKAFMCTKNSGTNWLGNVKNDPLQRLYGISFPDKDRMKKWVQWQEEAKEKDHRRLGTKQNLFFFHELSPGSCFFTAYGARIYNTLQNFIRQEYWKRGYNEVITPNVFNLDLWNISGHALHYKKNMFCFDVEGQEFGMKPMNCPGHCLMFASQARSWRELPIRMADFGVLHRNEATGALSGLTRVRRFQQDDAHIFCREEDVKTEVLNCLDFMKTVYGVFGMKYRLDLSTKPEKALGDDALWEVAEKSLADALDEFAGKGGWRVNPGDGAFYGPKIDIKVFDAMERAHQCATIQLDFQLPIRFGLRYISPEGTNEGAEEGETNEAGVEATNDESEAAGTEDKKALSKEEFKELKRLKKEAAKAKKAATEEGGEKKEESGSNIKKFVSDKLRQGEKRPIIVHRAMLGSLERMIGVLTEHFGGKWPFWLSPRQAMVIPISLKYTPYAQKIRDQLHALGFFIDVDDSTKTLNKKIREAQIAQYNLQLVVGEKEEEAGTVAVRTRANEQLGVVTIEECIALFEKHRTEKSIDI